MDDTAQHWTDDSTEDYLHAISSDFVRAVESAMGDQVTQSQLAERLAVSESRVSQVLNNPGNLTLRKIIEYSRALRVKVAVVLYADDAKGLIPSEIFSKCWQKLGKPRDFFEFDTCQVVTGSKYHVYSAGVQSLAALEIDFAQFVGATAGVQIGTFLLNVEESSSTPLPTWSPYLPQNTRRTQ